MSYCIFYFINIFEELFIWKCNCLESLNIDLLYKDKISLKNYCKFLSYRVGGIGVLLDFLFDICFYFLILKCGWFWLSVILFVFLNSGGRLK